MRISDLSSDVCSSDLQLFGGIEDALDRCFADACLVVAGARAFGDRRLLWRGRIGGAHGVSGCRVAAGASTPPSGLAAGKAEKTISRRHPPPPRRRAATRPLAPANTAGVKTRPPAGRQPL